MATHFPASEIRLALDLPVYIRGPLRAPEPDRTWPPVQKPEPGYEVGGTGGTGGPNRAEPAATRRNHGGKVNQCKEEEPEEEEYRLKKAERMMEDTIFALGRREGEREVWRWIHESGILGRREIGRR